MARPIQFDRNDVLDQALQAFWEHGYCATSMAKLVDATKLNPGSIYAAFNSKQGIFFAALDRYGERSAQRVRRELINAESPLEAIRQYFHSLAATIESDEGRQSCLLVNTVLELARHDDEVRHRINHHFQVIEKNFIDALQRAQERGELPRDRDCHGLAAFLMNNIWGLRVLAGTGPQPGRAKKIVNQVLAAL